MAKAGDWEDAGAREAFRVAVDRDVDRTVVTPPFWILVGSVPQAEHYRPLTVCGTSGSTPTLSLLEIGLHPVGPRPEE